MTAVTVLCQLCDADVGADPHFPHATRCDRFDCQCTTLTCDSCCWECQDLDGGGSEPDDSASALPGCDLDTTRTGVAVPAAVDTLLPGQGPTNHAPCEVGMDKSPGRAAHPNRNAPAPLQRPGAMTRRNP